MALLDGYVELANLALVLVLAAALSAVWLPAWALVTMPGVSISIALLMARQRRLAAGERLHARGAEQPRLLGDHLRDADEPEAAAAHLQAMLAELTEATVSIRLVHVEAATHLGEPDADERAGLLLTQQQSRAMGPGTGRHEEQPAWYLPLRGRKGSHGAALLRRPLNDAALRDHAQALCDQLGPALERARAHAAAAAAREEAQGRNSATTCWRRCRTTTERRWPPSWARPRPCMTRTTSSAAPSAASSPAASSTLPRPWPGSSATADSWRGWTPPVRRSN